jgi:hypothetical protein
MIPWMARSPSPERSRSPSPLAMQPAVERAAVRIATGTMLVFSAVYLVLAIQSAEWTWWLVFAEISFLTVVGFVQLRSGRVSLPFLWVLVVAATTMSSHLVGDPHRIGVSVAVAAVAATGWLLVESERRRTTLLAMAVLWAAQIAFPGARGWPMVYQATIFVAMTLGLRNLGEVVRKSRDRYQRLFEQAPVALWEEDFSEIDRWLHRLRRLGVRDLRAHLEEHPDEIDRALAMVNVLDVNPAAADLIEVEDAAGMLGPIDPSTYTAETRPAFLEQVSDGTWHRPDPATVASFSRHRQAGELARLLDRVVGADRVAGAGRTGTGPT